MHIIRTKLSWLIAAIIAVLIGPAHAGVSCSLPFTLTNGTLADASQVMANYTALVNCLGNAAGAGANSDITSLSAITSPIVPAQGGSNVFIGVAPTSSGTNIGITTTIPNGFTFSFGNSIYFQSPITNSGAMTINGIQVLKTTSAGPVPLTGSEFVTNQIAYVTFDGGNLQLITTSGLVSSTQTNQNITGGANLAVAHLGTFNGGSTLTVNCGIGPLQDFTNNGNMTIASPAASGSCVLRMINSAGAGTVNFSGFTTNANTGEALDTTNGHTFFISVVANGLSTFMVKALQ